jgi:Recombination endonuclease VII
MGRLQDSRAHGTPADVQTQPSASPVVGVTQESNRKARIASYGLTLEHFERLLTAQGYACGVCHEPFKAGQRIHVDHDHACCKDKCRSCGKCVRGLLCHVFNIALGHIELRYCLSRLYLDNPPAQFVARFRHAA